MISGLIKLAAIGTIAGICYNEVGNVDNLIKKATDLPKRILTVYELKTINKIIKYNFIGKNSLTVNLPEFCEKEIETKGRTPGTDYWKKPYRIFKDSTLYNEETSVTADKPEDMVIVSAGPDNDYLTEDDLTSKSKTDKMVKELEKKIHKLASKNKKKSK